MPMPLEPTPSPDINEFLSVLQGVIAAVLGPHVIGLYVVGSLAVGDFDPIGSDIDIIVVTDEVLGGPTVQRLQDMHEQFAANSSPWAQKLEAIYAPQAALRVESRPLPGQVPQLEKGTALFSAPLEEGWVFQLWTLRERGLVVCGPPPAQLGILTTRRAMAKAVRAVAARWLHDAEHDPTWLGWLRERENHLFVIQTLCRLLYSLETGEVTSKPHALMWGQRALGERWAALVREATQVEAMWPTEREFEETLAFVGHTHEQGRRR